jgi:hypothetical protein
MAVDPFTEETLIALAASRPVPRGIAFRPRDVDAREPAMAAVQARLDAGGIPWRVRDGALESWFEAVPAAPEGEAAGGMPLGPFWELVHQLRRELRDDPELGARVDYVEPLFLVASPQPRTEPEVESFALGFGQKRFGLWGMPYDRETERKIEENGAFRDWHLRRMNVRDAWDLWRRRHRGKQPGQGVVVGHPDTGYTDHADITRILKLPGRSFVLGEEDQQRFDGRDDLKVTGQLPMENPGHGTSTASVLASLPDDQLDLDREVHGVAPGAQVLPLRVSRSVIHLDFTELAWAIGHAAGSGADVISMSLGGPFPSEYLLDCIRSAHREGVIVVAAAGNYMPSTAFPAAYPEVIAAAATNAADSPWRFSGLGPLVDIAAPGEGVWCASSARVGSQFDYTTTRGTGTSFATACIAGLAALWLSYRGGRAALARHYGGEAELVPFAFQLALQRSAKDSLPGGKYGAGLADAFALLKRPLPSRREVRRFRDMILRQQVHWLTVVTGLLSGLFRFDDIPTVTLTAGSVLDARRKLSTEPVQETPAVARAARWRDAEADLVRRLLGTEDEGLEQELLTRIASDRVLLLALQRWRQGDSPLPLIDRLLDEPHGADSGAHHTRGLSNALYERLAERRRGEEARLRKLHRGRLVPGAARELAARADRAGFAGPGSPAAEPDRPVPGQPPRPPHRRLRAYAFDPSLETELATAPISSVTVPVRWEGEGQLLPGPVGEYLEVVDIDPASGCAYSPVDLNHPHILAQDGLAPSEGSPQFHQQMVYAVAMNTIHRFELALGRPIFWSPLRPWDRDRPEERHRHTPESVERAGTPPAPGEEAGAKRDRYVRRLRVYPHALRDANAYYSPAKRALLFGYFPASDDDTGKHFPGGTVFTCLSHDIIAHETTHALLDGMHSYFNEPSNVDVWAFHEAFADAVALFQHFTYPEVVRHQIANTRGDLETENLLGQLAQQFGQTTGRRAALRDALGETDRASGRWERRRPNPRALQGVHSPHERGSILVAALFDAFIALYNDRVADLIRISTGGTGVLPAGRIHPDLVNRLAGEAAQAAEEVLRIIIRAMDYVPPVDITFGDFLRALITADYDLTSGERRKNRIAFIDAFRSWGIYPRNVNTLSEESLRWRPPESDVLGKLAGIDPFGLAQALDQWQPGGDRAEIFSRVLEAQRELHGLLRRAHDSLPEGEFLLPGLDLRTGASFTVTNMRPARRIGPQGEFRTEMVVEVVQRRPSEEQGAELPFRGGVTLVVDLSTLEVRYMIYKRLYERLPAQPGEGGVPTDRLQRQREFEPRARMRVSGRDRAAWLGEDGGHVWDTLADTYAGGDSMALDEPFALLHRTAD